MDITQEKYLALHEASGIAVGDTVIILRKASSYEQGWADAWLDEAMDYTVGAKGIVRKDKGIEGFCVAITDTDDSYNYPFYALEKVASKKEVKMMSEITYHEWLVGQALASLPFQADFSYEETAVMAIKTADEIIKQLNERNKE